MITVGEMRRLNKQQWGNAATGIMVALVVDAALALTGLLISGGEGGVPTAYWVGAGVIGLLATIGLVGGGIWGSIDRHRMDVRRQSQPPTTIPSDILLPHPR